MEVKVTQAEWFFGGEIDQRTLQGAADWLYHCKPPRPVAKVTWLNGDCLRVDDVIYTKPHLMFKVLYPDGSLRSISDLLRDGCHVDAAEELVEG